MIVTGATVVCLLLLVRVTEVKADYVFEVQVDSYQNPTGRCLECQQTPSAPAGCCDDFDDDDFTCPSFAPDLCDTYFIFCLREFGTSGDDDTFCPLGRQETPDTITDMGTGLMTFQLGADALIGLPNPLSFSVPGDWPGRVQLLLVVMDRDPQDFQPDEVVARYFIQESLVISVGTEFTDPELFESMFADITLRFRVACADGFTEPNCEIAMTSSPTIATPVILPSSMNEAPDSIATQGILATTPLSMPQSPTTTTGAVPTVPTVMATSAANMEFTTQVPPPVGSSTATPSLSQLSTPPIAASPTSQTSTPLATTMSTPDETTTSSMIEENSQNPSSEPPSQTGVVSETPTLQALPEDPTDTMIPLQESSTASVPPEENTGTSSTSVIVAGAIVGGFVALLLAFTLIVLLLIILRKKRRRKHALTAKAGDGTAVIENPVYSDAVPGRYIGGGTGTEITAAYNVYDDVAVASSGIYQSVDELPQHYEEPAEVQHAMENRVPTPAKRNIYSTLSSSATTSKPLAAESLYEELAGEKGTFYQWGVYVPSEEERRNFVTGDGQTTSEVGENVYAALGEAQFKAGYVSSGPSPTFFEDSDIYWAPSSDKSELYEQLATKKYREIPRHQVQITDTLGEGQFGTVNKGIWQSPAGAKEVAVKTLKSQASEMDAVKFLQEAAINGQFKHPNVVKLFGVVTIGEPVMIVLELLANGDLRHYLNKQQPAPGEMVTSSTPPMLLNFCRQVAAGMEYLARKAFVHRDLAARNILVSEDKTCKVSDFGMSRDLADEDYYVSHGGKIPVKWTAPEALHYKKYSTASDVWSFGAVMYEIWSLGHKPFEGRTNAESIKLVDSGYRLPPPPGCPKEVYKWMIRCWHPERHARPQFSQLSEALNQPDLDLLTWSEEDAGVHPQAMVLGAPLEAGKQLYPELQDIYVEKQSPATQMATL